MPRNRKRTPFGVRRKKLTLDARTTAKLKAEKKVPRWITDDGTRVQDALEGDYEFVSPHGVKVGDDEEEQDRRIKKQVNKTKNNANAYLMAIPEQYHKEDQQTKEEQNMLVDESIRGGSPAGLKHHGVAPNQGSVSVRNVDYKP